MQNPEPLQPKRIHVSGLPATAKHLRYLITVDGHEISLQPRLFRCFVYLSFYRKIFPPGALHHLVIDTSEYYTQLFSSLRREITIQMDLGLPWDVYENDHNGYYWLAAAPRSITINRKNLEAYPDHDVAHLYDMLNPEPSKVKSANP